MQLLPVDSHSGRLMREMHHKEKKLLQKEKNDTKGQTQWPLSDQSPPEKDSGTTGLQRILT